jgi:hypothetical protein
MSFFGGNNDNKLDDGKKPDPNKPSTLRIVLWVCVAAVALYMIGSGIYGVMTGGN